MKKLKLALLAAASVLTVLATAALAPRPAYAESEFTKKGCELAETEEQKEALGCNVSDTAPSVAKNLINAVISIMGILAVGILVAAGQRYITSQGDPGQITQAKNMLLYGIVGLVVALLAFAIVNFILTEIFN